jgi:hypothetical protein
MNKSVASAIGGLVVGALAAVVYFMLLTPTPQSPCPGGDKYCIPVYVRVFDGNLRISPIPDKDVYDRGAVITWSIERNSGYTFPNDGIAFDKPGNPSGTSAEMINCHPAGDTKFVCTDRHTTLNRFGYTVKLVPVGAAPAVGPLDPWIINR